MGEHTERGHTAPLPEVGRRQELLILEVAEVRTGGHAGLVPLIRADLVAQCCHRLVVCRRQPSDESVVAVKE